MARHRLDQTHRPPPGSTGAIGRSATSSDQLFGRSLGYLVIGSLPLLILTLVSPVLVHILPPADFGAVTLALSLFQLCFSLAVFGFDQVVVVYNSRAGGGPVDARKLLVTASIGAFGFSAVLVATEGWWSPLVASPRSSTVIFVAMLWVGPAAVNAMVLALLRAEDRIKPFAVMSLMVSAGGQVLGLTALLVVDRDPVLYAASCAVMHLAAMFVGLAYIRPLRFGRALLTARESRVALRYGAPMAVASLSVYVLNSSDRIVVARLLGEVAVARYQVAYVIGSVILVLLSVLGNAWLPVTLRVRSPERRKQLMDSARDQLLWALVPLVAGLVVLTPLLLQVVAPASIMRDSLNPVIAMVAIAAFPFAHSITTSRVLISVGRTSVVGWATGIAAVVNVAANFAFVPLFGVLGSAAATLLALVVQSAIFAVATGDGFAAYSPAVSSACVAVSLAAFAIAAAPKSGTWFVARCCVGVVLIVLTLVALRRARATMSRVPTRPVPVPASRARTTRARHRSRPAPHPVPEQPEVAQP